LKYPEQFKNWAAAKKSADIYIAHQRTTSEPEELDVILGDDMLDQFWYVKIGGPDGVDRHLVEHAGWMWCGVGGGTWW
jgi:hypothetical protein